MSSWRICPPSAGAPLTLERMLGWLFAPLVWLFGVPWSEAGAAGGLMGIKMILTELVAYLRLAALPAGTLDPRSTQIMVYAMCGFANFASVGILIAGMSALMPERRDEIVSLALKALVSGTMASGLSGAMIGLLAFAEGSPWSSGCGSCSRARRRRYCRCARHAMACGVMCRCFCCACWRACAPLGADQATAT